MSNGSCRVICLSGAALRGDKSGGHKILDALALEGGLLYNWTKFLSEKYKLSGDLDWNGEIPRKKLVGTFFGVNNFSGHCWSCCEELSFVTPQAGRSSRHPQGATWQMSLEVFGKACLGDDHPRAFCSSWNHHAPASLLLISIELVELPQSLQVSTSFDIETF